MRPIPAIIEIIGCNGEQWTVSGPGMGAEGVELATDPSGLHDGAPINGIWRSSAYEEGATYQGHKIEPLDLVLSFNIMPSYDNWEEIESRFYASFSPDPRKPATIVYTGEHGRRTLQVVKLEQAKTESTLDPRIYQYSKMQLTLRGLKPFWEGETSVQTFMLQGDGTEKIMVTNRTDRPMWLKWAVSAPGRWTIPDYDLSGNTDNNKRRIVTPMLDTRQDLTIDTYPTELTYVADDGTNISGRFNGVEFLYPVPPRTFNHPYYVSFEEPKSILDIFIPNKEPVLAKCMCIMTEHWERPWGGHY